MKKSDEHLDPEEREIRLKLLADLEHSASQVHFHTLEVGRLMHRLSRDHEAAYSLLWGLLAERGNYEQIAEEAKLVWLEHQPGPASQS